MRSQNGRSRNGLVIVTLAGLIVLSSCRSSVEKADSYEAVYDRQFSQQHYPAALEAIKQAVAEDENQSRRWLKLARVQSILRRPSAAASSYQHALDLQPDSIEARENLAVLAVRAGQYDMAKRLVGPLMLLQPNNLGGLLARAAIAMQEKRFADADKDADTLIAGDPSREDGYIIKARILDLSGKTREAIALLEQRATADSDSADVLLQLMNLYQKLGDRTGIRTTAVRLMPLFPDDPRYAMESVRAYHARGQEDNVRIVLDRLQKSYGGNPSLMGAIASYWRSTAPPAVARAEIVKLADAAPPRVKFTLADMLVDMGAPKEATALLAPLAPATVTTENIDGQTHYARALFAAGQTAQAKAKVDAVLAFDSGNPDGLLLRARLALARKDYYSAVTDAQVVANDDDTNEDAALMVGSIYAAQGNILLAEKAYAEARSKFPDSTRALLEQAKWLIAQKRQDVATRNATSFARAHANRADAWRALRDICSASDDAACVKEAQAGLSRFSALTS